MIGEFATYSPSSAKRGSVCYVLDTWHKKQRTYHYSPDVDEHKERNVCKLLQGEEKWEDVIRHALRKAVHRMEGVARIWRGHYPLVMRLVQRLVYPRMMQSPMNAVHEQVRERYEKRKLQDVVC